MAFLLFIKKNNFKRNGHTASIEETFTSNGYETTKRESVINITEV